MVGSFALLIYIFQERNKIKNAASLVVLQIDELQIRVQEIQSYITDQGLNFSAFYESLPLMDANYWSEYKHLLIRKIDNKSYDNFNKFYQYIACMQEQQELLRNLQKNNFFVLQNMLSNAEYTFILETFKEVGNSIITPDQLQELFNSIPKSQDDNSVQTISNLIEQLYQRNPNIDIERFWIVYKSKRDRFRAVIDSNELISYTPLQISITLKAVLEQYKLLEILGTDGYRKLRKLARITDK